MAERDFKGIWIPKEIWLDDRLNALEKVIYAEIDSLSGYELKCIKSNASLAEFCQCSESKVSKAINKLIKLGYVEQVSFDGRHRTLQSCLAYFTRQDSIKCQADEHKMPASNTYNKTNSKKKINKEISSRSSLGIASGSSLDAQDSSLECDTDFNADNGIKKDTFYQRVRDDKPVLMNGVDISYAFSMLYSFYPKRVGKKEAASAFLDLVRENTKDRIIELAINIDTYKKYTFDNGTESKYIKNMQGFISSTQYNEYEKYNCDVLIGGKYYKTKQDYMDAVISGEVEMYLLPRSCIML